MPVPVFKQKRQRVDPSKLVWLRSNPGTLTRLHAEATVALALIEDDQARIIAAARQGDPIAEHLLETILRGRVWSAEECAAEEARRKARRA